MVTTQSLISDFHELSGATAKEKHKNFQKFLKTAQDVLNDQNQDEFFINLHPKDNFQEIFKIDLLSKFKRNEELLEVLKSGNREHIGRLLKNFEFFFEIITKIDAKTLVDDLLPNTSFIIRAKVVNRISKMIKNEKLAEEYFVAIEDKYGIRLALVVLPRCSIELIKKIIDKYNLELSPRDLFEIYKKDKHFLEYYFDLLKKCNENCEIFWKYRRIFKDLMKNDVDLFWVLQNKYKFDFQSGKGTTEKLIQSNKTFLNDGNKCVNIFHRKTLYKMVIKQDKLNDFVLSCFPEAPLQFLEEHMNRYSSVYIILKFLTDEKKFEIIQNLFKKKYSVDILDYGTLFNQDFFNIIPIELRVPLGKKLVETSEDFIYLLHHNESIPLIKGLLQNSSCLEERVKLMEQFVKIVEISNDENIRLEIMQFVYERYRNDTKSVIAFLTKIRDENITNKFHEEELKLLYKLFGYVNNEFCLNWYQKTVFSALLVVLIKNKKNYDDYLTEYLKFYSSDDNRHYNLFEHDINNYLHDILERSIILLDKFKDTKIHLNASEHILTHLLQFNLRNPKFKIPIEKYKHIIHEVFDKGNDNFYNIDSCIVYHVKNFKNANLEKYFWKKYNDKFSYMLTWFLKNDVKEVEENIEIVLSQRPNKINKNFLRNLKKYLIPTLKEKMLIYIKSHLSYDDFKSTNYLIRILSHIDTNEFLKLTTPFLPTDTLIEDNIMNKKEIQEKIIYSLSDLNINNKFELIKKHCIGDYLKYGLNPLYKITSNIKEKNIPILIDDLKNSPVSLRKHSLFLARNLLPIKDAWNFIDTMEKIEKNPSIKNVIFIKSTQLFIETPTKNNWEKLKSYFNIINENDLLIFDVMIKMIKKIPSQYKKDYIQNVYNALKKSSRKGIEKKIIEFSKNINTIDELDVLEEIIKTIINELFGKSSDWFVLWDLILNVNPKQSNQLLCFTLDYIKTILQPPISGYSKQRDPLFNLSITFCDNMLKNTKEMVNDRKDTHKNLIKTFIFQWNFIPKHCLIEPEMMLKITEAFYESDLDLEKFATPLNELLRFYVDKYDLGVVENFSKRVERLVHSQSLSKEDAHGMVHKLLENNLDKVNCIFAIFFFPYTFPLELNRYFKWVPVIKSIEKFIERNDKDANSVLFCYDNYLQCSRHEYLWIGNQEFPSVFTKE